MKPLRERRTALRNLIKPSPAILLSDEFKGDGADFLRTACEHGLEGIVSKRLEALPLEEKQHWLKTKCVQSGIFMIVGYKPAGGVLANIQVARLDEFGLHYTGAVGTGFNLVSARALRTRLDDLVTPVSPVPGLKVKGAAWTRPELAAEVSYRGLTSDGELRHASFKEIVESASKTCVLD